MIMELWEIKQFLNQRAEEVCQLLLPAGFRKGNRWTCGDVMNTPPSDKRNGGSLIVDLEGSTAGRWHDFAAGTHGNSLIDLWMLNRGVEFPEALKQIRAEFGLEGGEGRVSGVGGRTPQRPNPEKRWEKVSGHKEAEKPRGKAVDLSWICKPLEEDSEVWKWLVNERGISTDTLELYRVGQYVRHDKETGKDQHFVVFPFYNAKNELELVKARDIADKNNMWTKAAWENAKPMLLWGQQAIMFEGSIPNEVCITEGEIDAMTLADLGFQAVSVPYGAKFKREAGDPVHADNPNNPWLEHDMEWLDVVSRFYLCLDNDEPGRMATQVIFPRLGQEKCMQVVFPEKFKDANCCAAEGVDIYALFREARDMDPDELRRPSDFRQEIWEEFYPVDGVIPGEETPFTLPFRFRAGEVTVWQGYSGDGKSVMLNQFINGFATQGKKSCIASFEMKPKKTFKNMMRQATGFAHPSEETFNAALEWMDQWFFVFNRVGGATIAETIALFEYVAKKYGVHHFVIDSLMRLEDVNEEQAETTKSLMNWLQAFAKKFDVHVHLVCHSRKPDAKHPAEKYPPLKHSVSGSKAITDNADNVVCVWRNREKSDAMDDAVNRGDTEMIADLRGQHDARFLIQKCREDGSQEGSKYLFFDYGPEGSWQYREWFDDPKGQCLIPGLKK
jgi:twinkle protein